MICFDQLPDDISWLVPEYCGTLSAFPPRANKKFLKRTDVILERVVIAAYNATPSPDLVPLEDPGFWHRNWPLPVHGELLYKCFYLTP